jgi:hypothetical protein
MTNIIYGVNVESDFTAKDVREAILLCFEKAHNDILEQTYASQTLSPEEIKNLKNMDVKMLVKRLFEKTGGDYENPTKESLIKVIDGLKEFAINFRAEDIAERNYRQIMILINKLE